MKKLFTLFMALCLFAGLNAAPIAALSKKAVKAEKTQVLKGQYRGETPASELSLLKVQPIRTAASLSVKKAEGEEEIIPGTPNFVPDTVIAKWDGNYYAWYTPAGYINDWVFTLIAPNRQDFINLDLEYPSTADATKIACENMQLDQYSAFVLDADTFACTGGAISIAYVGEDNDGNFVYRFSGSIIGQDKHNAAHTETLTFDVELPVIDPYDYGSYIGCASGNYPDDCATVDIILTDKPGEVIVETVPIELNEGELTFVDFTDEYGIYALGVETEDYVGFAAFNSDNFVGQLGREVFDMSSSSFTAAEELSLDSIVASILPNEDESAYNVSLTFYPRYGGIAYQFVGEVGEPIDYTWALDAKEDLELSFTATMDTMYFADYDYIYVDCMSADEANEATFYFNIAALDPTSIIPTGVYPVNETMEIGTCDAAVGVVQRSSGFVPQAPYVIVSEDEEHGQLWYLVEGTVTVSYEDHLTIEVTGKNHNGYDLHYVIDVTGVTGIEQIVANTADGKVRKAIVDGHVMIVREGQVFNVLGARAK